MGRLVTPAAQLVASASELNPDSNIRWHVHANSLALALGGVRDEYLFSSEPKKFTEGLLFLYRHLLCLNSNTVATECLCHLLAAYIIARRGHARLLFENCALRGFLEHENVFVADGWSISAATTRLRLHSVDKTPQDDPFSQALTRVVQLCKAKLADRPGLTYCLLNVLLATRSLLVASWCLLENNLDHVSTPQQLLIHLLELSEMKAKERLPESLKAFEDGRPQLASRPRMAWKHLTTNQKFKPGKLLTDILVPCFVTWDGVRHFFADGDMNVLRFEAMHVKDWPGIGQLELSHSLEYLDLCGLLSTSDPCAWPDIEGGSNGQKFLALLDELPETRPWDAVAERVSGVMRVSGITEPNLTAAKVESASCKFLQVATAVLHGNAFSRDRTAEAAGRQAELSDVGKKLVAMSKKRKRENI